MTGTMMAKRTKDVTCTSTTPVFFILTGWMPTIAIQRLRYVIALVSRTANLSVQLGIQTADVDIEKANAPVAIGTAFNTQVQTFEDIDVTQAGTGNVNTKMYFRLGVFAFSSGASPEFGTVAVTPSFR